MVHVFVFGLYSRYTSKIVLRITYCLNKGKVCHMGGKEIPSSFIWDTVGFDAKPWFNRLGSNKFQQCHGEKYIIISCARK